MFDRLTKVISLTGGILMIIFVITAASIKIVGENVEVTGNLKVQGIDYAHVPVGTIVAYMGITAPAGWVLCNGSDISDALYKNLREFLTANGVIHQSKSPDLRGYFLRGLGGVDPDVAKRTLGSPQGDAFQGHQHNVEAVQNGFSQSGERDNRFSPTSNVFSTTSYNNDGMNGDPRVATETRPKNIAVNYIIKY